jgi:CRISPR/Cas system-associated exonuclease Cas4 (RecB family)
MSIVQKITSWSFSRWQCYCECPKKAYFKFILKLPEPSSPALERGTALHKLCEDYLRGIKKTVPKELKLIEKELKDFKKRKALAEAEFTFTEGWAKTGWFDRDAWVRVKADVTIPPIIDAEHPTAEVHDFKSGKLREGYTEYSLQLELYGLAALLDFPTAEYARTSLVFIDHGVSVPSEDVFARKDVKVMQKAWVTRTKKMLADTKFKPTPGNACRWCHFRKSNKGPCEF